MPPRRATGNPIPMDAVVDPQAVDALEDIAAVPVPPIANKDF